MKLTFIENKQCAKTATEIQNEMIHNILTVDNTELPDPRRSNAPTVLIHDEILIIFVHQTTIVICFVVKIRKKNIVTPIPEAETDKCLQTNKCLHIIWVCAFDSSFFSTRFVGKPERGSAMYFWLISTIFLGGWEAPEGGLNPQPPWQIEHWASCKCEPVFQNICKCSTASSIRHSFKFFNTLSTSPGSSTTKAALACTL